MGDGSGDRRKGVGSPFGSAGGEERFGLRHSEVATQ